MEFAPEGQLLLGDVQALTCSANVLAQSGKCVVDIIHANRLSSRLQGAVRQTLVSIILWFYVTFRANPKFKRSEVPRTCERLPDSTIHGSFPVPAEGVANRPDQVLKHYAEASESVAGRVSSEFGIKPAARLPVSQPFERGWGANWPSFSSLPCHAES
jgi:hypothetical protein